MSRGKSTGLVSRNGAVARSAQWMAEQLEQRVMLSGVTAGVAPWIPQGPGPVVGATTGSLIPGPTPATSNPATGAVHAIATVPNTANVIFIGATNGGIWRTEDGAKVLT